jgi:hypothetical protein
LAESRVFAGTGRKTGNGQVVRKTAFKYVRALEGDLGNISFYLE